MTIYPADNAIGLKCLLNEWNTHEAHKIQVVFSFLIEVKCTCLTRQFWTSLSLCRFKIAQVAVQSRQLAFKKAFRYCITRLDNWKFAELGPVHHISGARNVDAVYRMVGLWSRNFSNGWVIWLASIKESFFSRLHQWRWRIMLLATVFCRDFWETAVGSSWYFDAVFKLGVHGEYT